MVDERLWLGWRIGNELAMILSLLDTIRNCMARTTYLRYRDHLGEVCGLRRS